MSETQNATQLLIDFGNGKKESLDEMLPMVYEELRRLAEKYLRQERPNHTLQPTALVHEAYLRLIKQDFPEWESRSHFFGVAARLMRQILVEHARTHGCSNFYLETFSFQAPDFYRSLGYLVVHEHQVYPHGIVKHLMVKRDADCA